MGWKAPTSSSRDYEGGPVGLSRTRSGNDIEYFDSCRPRIWAQGPHQSKRTDAERRERVVDPRSGPKVRISPSELMRREERELSTQDLGPRSEYSVSTGSDKKGMCSRGPCISSFSIFTRPVSISSFRPKALSHAHSSLFWDSCSCSL